MKMLLLLSTMLLASFGRAQTNADGLPEYEFVDPWHDTVVCPSLVEGTVSTFYGGQDRLRGHGWCDCYKHVVYEVVCIFFTCVDCHNDLCIGRGDFYDYGVSGESLEVYEESFYFDGGIPIMEEGIEVGNWTHLSTVEDSTGCTVSKVDDNDVETQVCTCQPGECGDR